MTWKQKKTGRLIAGPFVFNGAGEGVPPPTHRRVAVSKGDGETWGGARTRLVRPAPRE